jgi:hypothetical protein
MARSVPLGGTGGSAGAGAGYSGTPLAKKLGVKAGHRLALIEPPDDLAASLGTLPDGVSVVHRLGPADLVLFFTASRALLERRLDALGRAIFPDGAVWVCWPKKAARVPTDMTEDVVREVVLPKGLVDVKVCAVNAVWSGLKIVWRTERRTAPS